MIPLEVVQEVRRLLDKGLTQRKIRQATGISRTSIALISIGPMPSEQDELDIDIYYELCVKELPCVAKIKKLLLDGRFSHREIALSYQVSTGTVALIARNETWTHVPWPIGGNK